MRLFVAIDLPEAVCERLQGLRGGLRGARWSEVNQMHVTLRFIGDVDPQAFDDIADSLADVDQSEFEMALEGVGHFPPRGQPRVLWAGVNAPPALATLHTKVEAAVVAAGQPADTRRFAPHVTLARFRKPVGAAKIGAFLEANAMFGTAAFPVDAFHLYASHLAQNGAVHTVECSYPLRPAD